jgi:hypothetical protein
MPFQITVYKGADLLQEGFSMRYDSKFTFKGKPNMVKHQTAGLMARDQSFAGRDLVSANHEIEQFMNKFSRYPAGTPVCRISRKVVFKVRDLQAVILQS